MSAAIDHSLPRYLQVAAELRREIAEGKAKPGERLPPARDLAAVAGVNQNTMFRALRVLRDEGLLEFKRGRGISVTGQAPGLSELVERCRDLLGYSNRHGYRKEELVRIIEGLS
jgi:GntR family transcriptional regulator